MSATDAMYTTGFERGWTVQTQLELALQYIDHQKSNDAFYDFLAQIIEDEDSYNETDDYDDREDQ